MAGPIRVMEHVWAAGRSNWGGLEPLSGDGDCNVWLLETPTGELALVDAGGGQNSDKIIGNIAALGRRAEDVKTILLTHSHFDHFLGAPDWQRRFGCDIMLHKTGAEYLARGDLRLTGVYMLETRPEPGECTIMRELEDGDTFRLGGLEVRVLHVPGHVPDAAAFLVELDGKSVAFTGDAAIGDQPTAKGCIGWLDGLWQSNINHYRRSMERLLAERIDVMCPGHGLWHEGECVRRSLEHCKERLALVASLPELGSMLPIAGGDPAYER